MRAPRLFAGAPPRPRAAKPRDRQAQARRPCPKGLFFDPCHWQALKAWLDRQAADTTRGFAAILYVEKSGWRAAGADRSMARLLEESTAGDDMIKSACLVSGWPEDRVRHEMITARQPTGDSQRKGKFGEVLHAAILEEFFGMLIAVKKHRYNPAPNASPHGVDLIALHGPRGGAGGDECIVYAETKLRTSADPNVLRDSYESLAMTGGATVPAHLAAEMERLHGSDFGMFCRIARALFGRQPPRLRIGLVVESSQWSDAPLDRLAGSLGDTEDRLSVDIVSIGRLEDLIGDSYAGVGSAA